MSDTDEDAIFVQAPDDGYDSIPELVSETKRHNALQIISVGSDTDHYAFTFHEEKLNEILSKVPTDCKVAVVSVVGAFRTGKSFLLSCFLQYLENLSVTYETNVTDRSSWFCNQEFVGINGFEWKAGSERNTTGIWMWSKPYIFRSSEKQSLAVLLVDTQGMFDNETTMTLTTSIFGLSTLISSKQIYNVDKRIQEDNLQQLALFSEYARIAMGSDPPVSQDALNMSETVDRPDSGPGIDAKSTIKNQKPFQHIEFLVRDWQNFECAEDDVIAMEQSMADYLEKVMADRVAQDLQETREQINSCFEQVTCFGLSHPGIAVTKKSFTGDIRCVDNQFLALLSHYCQKLFDPNVLQPKVIRGTELTADQLGVYIKSYANLFASGATFPTAATMLDATTSANNTNAVKMALSSYRDEMNKVSGPKCRDFLPKTEIEKVHSLNSLRALEIFDSVANFGSKRLIDEAKQDFVSQIEADFDIYQSLNEGRNPLAGWETYVQMLCHYLK